MAEPSSPVTAALARWRAALSDPKSREVPPPLATGPDAPPLAAESLQRDATAHEALLLTHPLVCVLAGAAPAATLTSTPLPDVRALDALPDTPPPLLDADGSQRLALAAATAGHSFVLQAPPGTAWAQTLANLVAERIGNGKTVLIVSPTPARLGAVARLLRDAGLGDFVLDLSAPTATAGAAAPTPVPGPRVSVSGVRTGSRGTASACRRSRL